MLDTDMKEQLRSVFQSLTDTVSLHLATSTHEKQDELRSMLEDLTSCSDKIKLVASPEPAKVPTFRLSKGDEPTGIAFQGIPGGHEFTSLILAILNTAGLGKLPDAGIISRIQSLKGPLDIKTYISLSCENCPDVVQALNVMSLYHKDFKHTMVDGGLVTEEMTRMNIQGVPSVYVNGEPLHSGRANLAELLTKLEEAYADKNAKREAINLGHADVVVIGGGPAGSSAAIYSVRKGLKTFLIAEKVGGQVQETKGIENLISTVYTEGPQLSANLDQHMRSYPIELLEHRRVDKIEETDGKKQITLNSGEYLTTDSVIIATGAKWRELGVPGEKQYIGRGVAFCPHCDGPYYKGKKVAVVGGGNSGVEAAIDLAGICREVVLFEFMDKLKADEVLVKKLKSLPNVSIVTEAKTKEVLGNGDKVIGMSYEDRKTGQAQSVDLDGIFVQIGLSPNSAAFKDLVEVNKFGEIVIDPKGRTSRPGIYAAGDVTTVPFKQIVIAMGEGAKVALTAFEDRMRA